MRRKYLFIGLLIAATLLLIFRNQLLFYFQVFRLKPHLAKTAPCGENKTAISEKLCMSGFYSKVWAHRVDSYQRYKYLSTTFSGFEVDVAYDSLNDIFDVGHPPVKSIGLSFETYLKYSPGDDKFFWLDLKNLSAYNVSKVISLLGKLDHAHHIMNRVIIESGDIYALSRISEAGYFTSFYFDTVVYNSFLSSGPQSTTDSVFRSIDAVSADVLIYDTLRTRFPDKTRLSWALSAGNYLSDSLFSRLDRDENLLIYLVNIKSPGYR